MIYIMNIILYMISIIMCNTCFSINRNYTNRLRNTTLRIFLFKERKMLNIIKNFKFYYTKYYEKSIACIGEGIIDYNNLSEEEKTIIEAIISLCY